MSSSVIDASFAVRLILPSTDRARCQAVLDSLRDSGITLVAPMVWRYEVLSALAKAVFFGQLLADEARREIAALRRFEVDLMPADDELAQHALAWAIRLRRASAYDCFYLALAEELGCDLWTMDQHLARAAAVPWVRTIGPE